MKANQVSFPVRTMARVLRVPKAGFYAWSGRAPSARHMADGALLARVQDLHAASRGVYETLRSMPPCGRRASVTGANATPG